MGDRTNAERQRRYTRGGDGCILCRGICIQIDLEGNDGNLD
jgi:hypothetical protein